MTHIAILPVQTTDGVTYCAVSNGKRSEGATAGEALDALTAQLPEDEKGTVVIFQNRRPDQFFAQEQQARLAELMARWRTSQAGGPALTPKEEGELSDLVDAELRGAGQRAESILSGRPS